MSHGYEYDVALSYAYEDRAYVDRVANFLRDHDVEVFYDQFKQVDLWGKDLYVSLDDIYRKRAQYCVIFISKAYANKAWTNHERESAQARAIKEDNTYILPARFDNTEIPGLRDTIAYIDLKDGAPEDFGKLILEKLDKSFVSTELIPEDTFRKPKFIPRSFNPYVSAQEFMWFVINELDKRCKALSGDEVSMSMLGDGSKEANIRIVRSGKTKYSIDIVIGSAFGPSSINFYGTSGERMYSHGATNAFGKIVWDKEKEAPILELHDMSLLETLGGTPVLYAYVDFIDNLWDKICDALEEDNGN